jgi:site-specific DNA-methyltransferase (adenine-specific)
MKINHVFCGDSLNILREIPDKSVNLVITSPPYFQQRAYFSDKELGREETIEEYLNNLSAIFSECVRVCSPVGNIVFNVGDKYIDQSLQLIPYKFAIKALEKNKVKLVNEITWVKTNPTPRQFQRRLVSATEPFFHFVKGEHYYYDLPSFLNYREITKTKFSPQKGMNYKNMIKNSDLTLKEKFNAILEINSVLKELSEGKISDFRMKIRGVHKLAFGGQSGGRNSQIEKKGYTIIRMYGRKLKRDVLEFAVDSGKDIDHPAIFPLKVIKELVLLLCPETGIILDPFCGSGTSLVVAKNNNRKYIGIDISKKYCDISLERLK